MSGMIDTNILLYAANGDVAENAAARAFLLDAGRSSGTWYLTEGILYEFLRVATHPKVFPQPLGWKEALAFLAPVLESPVFQVVGAEEGHWALLGDVLGDLTHPAGNLFFDVRTAVLMQEHGIRRIYTADTDFLQFTGIEVINPLRG